MAQKHKYNYRNLWNLLNTIKACSPEYIANQIDLHIKNIPDLVEDTLKIVEVEYNYELIDISLKADKEIDIVRAVLISIILADIMTVPSKDTRAPYLVNIMKICESLDFSFDDAKYFMRYQREFLELFSQETD